MIIDKEDKNAFADYEAAFYKLEMAFGYAKAYIEFHCFVLPPNNKIVEVLNRKNKKRLCLICIEGDSPAQAVKDVAAAVRL